MTLNGGMQSRDDASAYVTEHGVLRLGDALRSHRSRPGAGPVAISLAVHALAVGAFFYASAARADHAIKYQTIAIHLVSPPPTEKGPPQPVETTSAVVTAPKVEPKKAEPKVTKPKVETQSAENKKVVSKPTTAKPAQGARPKPGPVGGEGLNIVQEGVAFAYPEYTNNVIRKLIQYFRWEGTANLTAEVSFRIRPDGSISGIELLRSSGNTAFDLAATDAVENAGRQKAMGPLPKNWQGPYLPIRFTFAPNN
jgi:TonB family protein